MENINITNNIFAIHEDFFPDVEKKINRIIRKCKQYGNPFTFNVVGEEMRNEKKDESGAWHKFILVEVGGTAHIDNWEFIATLDIHENGNVIRRYNTNVDLPDYFKTSPNVCDHCHTARNRNNLYVIRNTETGEFKQVGGNCLQSYTNGLNLEYVVSWIDGLTKLYESDGVFYGSGGKTYHSVENVIFYANVLINKMGYLRNDPYSYNLSTKELVCNLLGSGSMDFNMDQRVKFVNEMLENHRFEVQFSVSDFDYNTNEIQPIIDYYKSCEGDSEFIHNVKVILEDGFASYKDLGYLCYLPQGYAKHMEREAERAARRAEKRSHWGEVGKRYKDMPIQGIRRVASYETMYGAMNVYQIVLEDGTVLTWKTSNYADSEISTVSFTVKDHGEYNGVPQTVVTRCKFAA